MRSLEKENRLIMMAFEMKRIGESSYYGPPDNRKSFKLKIGIHKGPIIAGVIGYHKPQFSLIGDTVNTTSRICSKCHEGCITVSEPIY
jgi:class 3 adenylate cyclase